MAAITRHVSQLDTREVRCGIVHIGLGAFHRAHQAVYVQQWLDRNGGGPWGICAANIRSNRRIVDALNAGHGRYHVAEFRDSENAVLREVRAIREALFAGDDTEPLIARMLEPDCRIVSLTVTEKGYGLSPSEERLLTDEPGIAHDLAEPRKPRTAPGIVLEALRRRREARLPPFTVLCCDNMPANGKRTAFAVMQLAESQSAELADWVLDNVAFPCTMVDRIVPAMTEESRATLEQVVGHADPAGVICEAFSQWVVEDRFPAGRPDWESEGVEMVDNVQPYETMKLRMLNGAHSLLAYAGLLRGHATVAEAIADTGLMKLVREFLREARSTLRVPAHVDLDAYEESMIARFANDQLEHRLMQIAMDGSQKLPQRWLDAALERLDGGEPSPVTAVGVAAWMKHVTGRGGGGKPYDVDDPIANELAGVGARARSNAELVDGLLAIERVFPVRLARHSGFRGDVLAAFEQGRAASI